MVDDVALRPYLDGANVDVAVLALRPDYRALLPAVDEDLPKYRGAPRLMGANGTEPFDTVVDGVGRGSE
jgi:predicted TIM-barrel enzyme